MSIKHHEASILSISSHCAALDCSIFAEDLGKIITGEVGWNIFDIEVSELFSSLLSLALLGMHHDLNLLIVVSLSIQ
jgi:hypothetical protein